MPEKLTTIVVDDELFGRENLKQILDTYCPEVEVSGMADSVLSAMKLVDSLNPDVVFLDINMPVLDGFDFLDEFQERRFKVVLVTGHCEFGIRAVKAGATDYITKPINIKELKQCIKNLLIYRNQNRKSDLPQDESKLVISSSHGFEVLMVDEILHLEADGCYTNIWLVDGKKRLVSRTLKEFEETLPKVKFFRVHKSHLVNLSFIKDFSNLSGSYVTMTDGSRIDISRRKVPDFIHKIRSFMKSV
ncbi:MAG: response regulator transcription factor [Bacteroidales bacterium]|nr:response regulator transcription factor [Bacteroidales bacterium]